MKKTTTYYRPQRPQHPAHRGNPVAVGSYIIFAAGTQYLQQGDAEDYDLLLSLNGALPPLEQGGRYNVWSYELKDFGGVPGNWASFVRDVARELSRGTSILAFCAGSHGRTGCLLASLISLLEPETADPIAAARLRHCDDCVETVEQAKSVFDIRNQRLPRHYKREFTRRPAIVFAGHFKDSDLSRPIQGVNSPVKIKTGRQKTRKGV